MFFLIVFAILSQSLRAIIAVMTVMTRQEFAMTNKMANFNFRVPVALRDEFKRKAQRNGKTATALLIQWMEDYCNDSNDGNDEDEDSYHRTSNDDNDRVAQLEEKLNQLSDQVDALQDSNDSNDNTMTTLLEARLSEALEGVSCLLPTGSKTSDNSIIDNLPSPDNLSSPLSGIQLAEVYGLPEPTLRGYVKGKKPRTKENRQIFEEIKKNWERGEDKKWYKKRDQKTGAI